MSSAPAGPNDSSGGTRETEAGEAPLLPFSQWLPAREDEEIGLRGLFEKVFYGTDLAPRTLEALQRIRFQPKSEPEARSTPPLSPDATRTILLNRGETGIGKTRIFRQFRQRAAERRIPVYEIHCYDVEGIPFKPFLRVINEILRDFELSEALREKYRHTLKSLLPESRGAAVAGPGPESPGGLEPAGWEREWGGSEGEMVRVFDSLTQLLFEITALKPVVILVHDLHWGDRGTIELLRYIGRNLQLRNSRIAASASPRRRDPAGPLPAPRGPELGDDEGEWRELSSRSARGLESVSEPAPVREEDVLLEPTESPQDHPVRLMVLANYRGFDDASHYLERAIRSLGEEPFAFHGEIRTLSREETGRFFERSLSEVPAGRAAVSCGEGAIDLVYQASEGFPSYIHELLRLLFLPSGAAGAVPPAQ